MTLLASLDLSSNRLNTLAHLRPLARLPALVSLRAAANPLALLPNYRRRVIARGALHSPGHLAVDHLRSDSSTTDNETVVDQSLDRATNSRPRES